MTLEPDAEFRRGIRSRVAPCVRFHAARRQAGGRLAVPPSWYWRSARVADASASLV